MAAIYTNFFNGTVADNPLSSGATTMTCTALNNLQTITSPDYCWLTIDPGSINGAPEIVKVTAHTNGTNTATIVRAQQGTSARTHQNGERIVMSYTEYDIEAITTTPRSGFRNAIINGAFDIWQRGTGTFVSGFSADRWFTNVNGSTTVISRQSFTLGNSISGYEPTYFLRHVVTSVAAAGNFIDFNQTIESVRSFAGQTITTSFWAKADANKNISISFHQFFGTGGSPSATVDIPVGLISLTTSWQKFVVTTAISSISGKTIGTNNDDYLSLRFWFDAGSTFNTIASSLGQQSGTFDLWGIQVESGLTDTPLERRPIGTELALCQRYYYRQNSSAAGDILAQGQAYGTTNWFAAVTFPVTMRKKPTAIDVTATPGDYNVYTAVAGTVAVATGPFFSSASTNSMGYVNGTTASGLVAGNATQLSAAGTAAYIGFTAEL